MQRALAVHPGSVRRIDREDRRRKRRNLPAIASGQGRFPELLPGIGQMGDKGLAVLGNEGVEIDKRANSVRQSISDVAYDDAAVRVSDQDDIMKVFPDQQIDDVRDMSVEANVAAQEMAAFPEAGQRRSQDPLTFHPPQVTYAVPAPAAMPGAVDHDVIGHFGVPFVISGITT